MKKYIETERLLIMAPNPNHLLSLITLQSDPDVMTYVGNRNPRSKDEVTSSLKKMIQHHKQHGFSLGAIYKKNRMEYIGRAGLVYLDNINNNNDIEVAYMLKKNEWNNGYATECVKGLITWGFETLDLKKIIAVTHPENKASLKVMKKCGMRRAGTYSYCDIEAEMYKITFEKQ